MIYDGGLGETLEVRDDGVVITPKGVFGVVNRGLKNEKFIPYSSIAAVQFKDAGLIPGYLQFTVPGGIENTQGLPGTWKDENTVNFSVQYDETFRAIRDYIQARIGGKAGSSESAQSSAGEADQAAEGLSRFADLRDRGVITPEEFEKQKQALLAPRLPQLPLPQPPLSPQAQSTAPARPMSTFTKSVIVGCFLCLVCGMISFVILGTRMTKNAPADASQNAAQAAAASIGAPLEVESTKLASDYAIDPEQAERKYRNQGMHVSGRVEAIVRDQGQAGSIELRGAGRYRTIAVYLVNDDGKPIKLHQRVTLNCDSASNSSGRPTLTGCVPM